MEVFLANSYIPVMVLCYVCGLYLILLILLLLGRRARLMLRGIVAHSRDDRGVAALLDRFDGRVRLSSAAFLVQAFFC